MSQHPVCVPVVLEAPIYRDTLKSVTQANNPGFQTEEYKYISLSPELNRIIKPPISHGGGDIFSLDGGKKRQSRNSFWMFKSLN